MKRITGMAILLAILTLTAPALWAQVQDGRTIITPTPMTQGGGGITPYFWIGLQSIFSAGYNIETGAGGFRDYGRDNHTYASFNIAFVDSHFSTPKIYEVGSDPNIWSGKFKLMNFTGRLNSYDTREINNPHWLAEISGKGAHIGFFSQAGMVIGSLDDTQNTDGTQTTANDPKPWAKIYAGNKVLDLGDNDLGKPYYNNEISAHPSHETYYGAAEKGSMMYVGYEKPNVWNTYITMLSEGNVNSDLTKNADGTKKNDGFAAAMDFGLSPLGLVTDDEHPLTFNLTGNAVTGTNFESNYDGNFGFGLKAESGHWLWDAYSISPVIAFDGKLDTNDEFTWKTGGGLTFHLSGMRWVADEWNEIPVYLKNYSVRYENSQILKSAYAQAYLAYSDETDLDMVLKFEEPDGDAGFHEKLGALYELRLYNLTGSVTGSTLDWSMWGRLSWDIAVKSYLITPYARAYFDSAEVFKLRLGAQANFIPYTGFEIAYTSANLNPDANSSARPMSHYDGIKDAGRLELIVILKSDNARPKTPKRMDFWNYSTYNGNWD
jgi:hypothetical protein